jgi:hypothetical protein
MSAPSNRDYTRADFVAAVAAYGQALRDLTAALTKCTADVYSTLASARSRRSDAAPPVSVASQRSTCDFTNGRAAALLAAASTAPSPVVPNDMPRHFDDSSYDAMAWSSASSSEEETAPATACVIQFTWWIAGQAYQRQCDTTSRVDERVDSIVASCALNNLVIPPLEHPQDNPLIHRGPKDGDRLRAIAIMKARNTRSASSPASRVPLTPNGLCPEDFECNVHTLSTSSPPALFDACLQFVRSAPRLALDTERSPVRKQVKGVFDCDVIQLGTSAEVYVIPVAVLRTCPDFVGALRADLKDTTVWYWGGNDDKNRPRQRVWSIAMHLHEQRHMEDVFRHEGRIEDVQWVTRGTPLPIGAFVKFATTRAASNVVSARPRSFSCLRRVLDVQWPRLGCKPSGGTGMRVASGSAPAAKDSEFHPHSWWEQPAGSSLPDCLSNLSFFTFRDKPDLQEHVPDPQRGNVLVPAPGQSAPQKAKPTFFANLEWVIKVYCIGEVGRPLEDKHDRVFAAAACIDAGATAFVGEELAFEGITCGLVHARSAYVCIVRRRLELVQLSPEEVARFFQNLATQTGVSHNDGHVGNLGWNPKTDKYEPFDFERATRCNPGCYPPYEFLLRWARTVPGRDTDAKTQLMKELEPHGLRTVYGYYMDIWSAVTRGFITAFDSKLFRSAPLGSW